MTTRKAVFGPKGADFLSLVEKVVRELDSRPTRYTILDVDSFRAVASRDLSAGMVIYWSEMLGRAHLAAVTSMIRSYRWCAGMEASHQAKLFLPYCACFRGLVESVADTYDALNGVAITLAENCSPIDQALRGEAECGLVCKELEDALIHFSYAHKPTKGAAVPNNQIAKTVADYLKPLTNGAAGDLKALYAELCQFTHPAAHSVQYMMIHENQSTMVLLSEHEQVRIDAYAERHQAVFPSLLMLAFNAPVLVLKVLRSFDVPDYHVESVAGLDLSDIPIWKRISGLLAAR